MALDPMPCCGTPDPDPVWNGEQFVYPGYGWGVDGKCRTCGADVADYTCASPPCRHAVAKEDRFCEGCGAAYTMARTEAADDLENRLEELLQKKEPEKDL